MKLVLGWLDVVSSRRPVTRTGPHRAGSKRQRRAQDAKAVAGAENGSRFGYSYLKPNDGKIVDEISLDEVWPL